MYATEAQRMVSAPWRRHGSPRAQSATEAVQRLAAGLPEAKPRSEEGEDAFVLRGRAATRRSEGARGARAWASAAATAAQVAHGGRAMSRRRQHARLRF